MADDKNVTIIKKVKGGGHGGHHGGAWKVAYADFVTAMMAFFLVMWLLGSDEETKAAIEDYFNNPSSPFRQDLASDEVVPMGDKTGAGESVLSGLDGQYPKDMIDRPSRPYQMNALSDVPMDEMLESAIDRQDALINLNIELVRFSVPESRLFRFNTDLLKEGSKPYLDKLGRMLSKHRGHLAIKGYSHASNYDGQGTQNPYEFTTARVVALMKHFTKNNWIAEERIAPVVTDRVKKRDLASPKSQQPPRMVEFILSTEKLENL